MSTALSLVLGYLWLAVPPADGQITSYVDENGRRVFVNTEEPAASAAIRGGNSARGAAARPNARPANGSPAREHLVRLAHSAAERHELDPALIHAVIEAESNWNPRAVSHKGARGLMQLMPATAADLGVDDVFDPEQNLDAGVRHLRALIEKYNGDLDRALAAYNAGGGAVDRAGGIPNIAETRNYVQKITENYFRPGSNRQASFWRPPQRQIYVMVDASGKRVFTNE